MKQHFRYPVYCYLLVSILSFILLPSCEKPAGESDQSKDFNVSGIVLPESIECQPGSTVDLQVVGGHGPLASDVVELAGAGTFTAPVTSVSEKNFTFVLPDGIFTGDYVFSILRGSQSKRVGKVKLMVSGDDDIEPDGATVYGVVSALGKGLEGVVVSDGYEVAATDRDGVYRLNSNKHHGYVFICVPSGYEPLSDGILPKIWATLGSPEDVPERVDFTLNPVSGQDNSTLLMLGDIHLARRTNDRKQFSEFVNDINSFVSSTAGPVYGITLGDMTWDLYWLVNNYGYSDYLKDANAIRNLRIYHTIGNHDHSMYYAGDFDTVAEYKKLIAPTYYSFNIGKFHLVVLDDVECTNSKPTTDSQGTPCYVRDYRGNVVSEQLQWLQKDLSYVSEGTPLMIMMHIPLCNASGSWRLSSANAAALKSALSKYPGAHIYTAHTHTVYNVDKLATDGFFEHNAGSVCGTWWWSANETPGIHIGQDGSPGGYTVVKTNGTNLSWQYKATGSGLDYQFRTYDRNNINITVDKYVPAGNAASKAALEPGLWGKASSANEVYVNVWNWDPSWKVEILESGKSLDVTRVSVKDPLHLISYTAKRLNKSAEASFATTANDHTFRAAATTANSTLTIRVTDRFGNKYEETMQRPKSFDIKTYEK